MKYYATEEILNAFNLRVSEGMFQTQNTPNSGKYNNIETDKAGTFIEIDTKDPRLMALLTENEIYQLIPSKTPVDKVDSILPTDVQMQVIEDLPENK